MGVGWTYAVDVVEPAGMEDGYVVAPDDAGRLLGFTEPVAEVVTVDVSVVVVLVVLVYVITYHQPKLLS